MRKTPHLVQYQGSKRIIAPEIVKFFPPSFDRLIEPFSGTCAITIFSAMKGLCDEFWINDINEPLHCAFCYAFNNILLTTQIKNNNWYHTHN